MLKVLAAVAALLAPLPALAQTPAPEPIQVMVLAAPHLDNPGRDVHNARMDPVTTPQKQAELAAIADALAAFQPAAIAIESLAPDPSTLLDAGWPAYRPEHLLENPDERVQIGYRLAQVADVSRVYAIDEKDREGEPSYFPYGDMLAWIEANGRTEELAELGETTRAFLAYIEQRQATHTLGALLAEINARDHPMAAGGNASYYRFLAFGGDDDYPGAELNGRWYTRNAVIFAKLIQVAEPGDRVVVIFGAGHAAWLRHFVETTPGFELVEPGDYLGGL